MNKVEKNMRGSPYLHDFFTSILHYDHKAVLGALRKSYPNWKLVKDYQITYSREEPPVRRGLFGDVVWQMVKTKHGRMYPKTVIHEVKTGNYSLEEVWQKYRGSSVRIRGEDHYVNSIFVWAWEEIHRKNLEDASDDLLRQIRKGVLRMVPLEILLPIAITRIKELENVFQANLEKWDPETDYAKKVRDAFREKAQIDLWNKVEPDTINILIEYEYSEWDDLINNKVYKRGINIIREDGGSFSLSVLGGVPLIALVPITCDKCGRTFFLPAHIEDVGGDIREMGPETIWAVTYQGGCPKCGYPISLDIELYEYPMGLVGAVNVLEMEGCRFPSQIEVNSKRMGH